MDKIKIGDKEFSSRLMVGTGKFDDFEKRVKDAIVKSLAYIGKNSLIIYGLHSLIFLTYPYTGIYNFFAQQFGRGILTMATQIIYTLIIGVTICYGMQQIMKIYNLIKSH